MSFVSMATMRSSKSNAAFVHLALEQLIEFHDIKVRSTFHRRASGDRVVLRYPVATVAGCVLVYGR
jgi:hypothetical protein